MRDATTGQMRSTLLQGTRNSHFTVRGLICNTITCSYVDL